MRVIVVNAKGGQAEGPPLAKWLKTLKPLTRPLVVIISEADAPAGVQDRIVNALTAAMPASHIYRGSTDHGAREVAVLVLGSRFKVAGARTTQLTPGHGWNGAEQDRWVEIVWGTYRPLLSRSGRRVAVLSTHASTRGPASILEPLAPLVAELEAKGYEVVLGADFNAPDGPHSPVRLWANAQGFALNMTRVMGCMVSKGVKVRKVKPLPLTADISDHPTALSLQLGVKQPRPLAPKPYALTTRDGHTIDQLTNYALFAVEKRLGYTPGALTVVQGSYNVGVSASAGTHDGGGAVDLTPVNWEQKVHAARAVGFAAWHRPAIPGLWGEHIHCILIGNAKLSPAAAAQVPDYRNHRDGLADNGPDNTWHPDPIPTFRMPKYAQKETA